MLWEMPEKQLEPHVISHSAAISACEKGEQWQKALALLWEMPEKQLESDVICYSMAIRTCGKGGWWREALGLLRGRPGGWPLPELADVAWSFAALTVDLCRLADGVRPAAMRQII